MPITSYFGVLTNFAQEKAKSASSKDGDANTRSSLPQKKDKENYELSTALRRRRERYTRQSHHIIQQEMMNNNNGSYNEFYSKVALDNDLTDNSLIENGNGYRNLNGVSHDEDRMLKNYTVPEILVNGLCKHFTNRLH